jgi:hypothetical protein
MGSCGPQTCCQFPQSTGGSRYRMRRRRLDLLLFLDMSPFVQVNSIHSTPAYCSRLHRPLVVDPRSGCNRLHPGPATNNILVIGNPSTLVSLLIHPDGNSFPVVLCCRPSLRCPLWLSRRFHDVSRNYQPSSRRSTEAAAGGNGTRCRLASASSHRPESHCASKPPPTASSPAAQVLLQGRFLPAKVEYLVNCSWPGFGPPGE